MRSLEDLLNPISANNQPHTIMSQDSIFNVQPGGESPEQPNPFQPLADAESNSSPFASVEADKTPFGAVSEETTLPERRPSAVPAQEGNPFQLVEKVEPAMTQEAAYSGADRGNAGSPFEMTGLGVAGGNGVVPNAAQMNGVRADNFAPDQGETSFAAVEAPHHAALEPVQDFAVAATDERGSEQAATQVDEVGGFQIPREEVQQAAPQGYVNSNPNPRRSPGVRASGAMRQLELRAIFGVNHELTVDEILQRARSLPGVRNISVVEQAGAQALNVLQTSINQIGFADGDSVGLHCPGGMIDFITEGGSTVAILHEGEYAAGVCETLIIACREISKLG